jgi:Zn-dependent peptidase ImmA (M78 family)
MPISLTKIINDNGIILLKNSKENVLDSNETGTSILEGDDWLIIYDDTIEDKGSRRFTIAHELGHIFLGHPLRVGGHAQTSEGKPSPIEKEANQFAARLLCPACVLWGLDIHTAEDIAKVCEISIDEANERAKRMKLLYEREKFLTSPLEERLYENFKKFIENPPE